MVHHENIVFVENLGRTKFSFKINKLIRSHYKSSCTLTLNLNFKIRKLDNACVKILSFSSSSTFL